jgi:hypothetical protein
MQAAAEILRSYACNTKVADWKVAYLGAAAWWFRLALATLLLFALLLALYVPLAPPPLTTSSHKGSAVHSTVPDRAAHRQRSHPRS